MWERICRYLFGTPCGLCSQTFRFGGGEIRMVVEDNQFHQMKVCEDCCEIMEITGARR